MPAVSPAEPLKLEAPGASGPVPSDVDTCRREESPLLSTEPLLRTPETVVRWRER